MNDVVYDEYDYAATNSQIANLTKKLEAREDDIIALELERRGLLDQIAELDDYILQLKYALAEARSGSGPS